MTLRTLLATFSLTTMVSVRILSAPAFAESPPLNRAELAARLAQTIDAATSSIHIAAGDCTFGLISAQLRAKATDASLRGKIVIALDQTGRCELPGYQPAPPPYTLEVRRLVPIRVDDEGRMVHRREFVLTDMTRLTFVLSDAREQVPQRYFVEEAMLGTDSASRQLVRQLGGLLWPGAFPAPDGGEAVRRDPRWSTANHRLLTTSVLGALGFMTTATSIVETGNVTIDRLANQFNNPQHSMRNLGQTVESAKAEAAAWVASRRAAVEDRIARGDVCCALFALGEGLHTVQDRKHGFIPLYQHLVRETISDYKPEKDPEDWSMAERETRTFCDDVLAAVGALGADAVTALKAGTGQPCRCDGFAVTPKP
jgi:hypothetical protein